MKIVTTLLLGAMLLLAGCNKKEPAIENQMATMHVSPNSVCNVYIQLDSGSNIYPVNTETVEPYLTEGRRVTVSYRPTSDYASPCPNARSAIIEDIR